MNTVSDLSGGAHPLSMMVGLGLMGLLPFAVLALTSFSKMAVVLSLLRSAVGTQQAPPTLVLTALAGVLTAHVMAPVAERVYANINEARAKDPRGTDVVRTFIHASTPLREFLVRHGSDEERARFVELGRELRSSESVEQVTVDDLAVIVPAFVVTELKEAFQVGFLVLLPFLIVDMLAANVLLALGMQSLAPTQVSLPFKLLLFVAVDGWALLSRGLVLAYR